MSLEHVKVGDPHASAHNEERDAIVQLQNSVESLRTGKTPKDISVGYSRQSLSGSSSFSVAYGTYAIDLTGNTSLTLIAENGVAVSLDVVTNGNTLTIASGPTISADGLYTFLKSRDVWKGGTAGSSSGTSAPTASTVTAAAPTFTDNSTNGGGTYVIPTSTGVDYKTGGSVVSSGTYQAAAGAAVTIQATAKSGYSVSGTTSWAHTYPAAPSTSTTTLAATAPTFSDNANGGGTYAIPSQTGVAYSIAGTIKAAGTYTADPSASITIVATATYGYTLAGTTSWAHAYPSASVLSATSTLDFTTKTVGTAVNGMVLSGGEKIVTNANSKTPMVIVDGYGAGLDDSKNTSGVMAIDALQISKSATKLKVTFTYAFSAANANTYVCPNIYCGPGGVGGANIGLRIKSTGSVLDVSNSNMIYTSNLASTVNVPLSGTIVITWDGPSKTGTWAINGTTVATFTGSSSNFTNPVGFNIETEGWDGAKVGIKTLSVETS